MKTFTQFLFSTAACCLAGITLVSPGSVRAADVSTDAPLGIPLSSMNWRYAYSCDGYNQDRDDVAGSAMVVAIFDRAGRATNLVHYHFNTSFGGAPRHAEEHRKSVLWTAVLFGVIKEENADDGFFDVSRSPEEKAAAIQHLAGEIRKSTAEHPLMIFCGGGVQVPCSALELAIKQGASPAALKSVTFVSHSIANERDQQKGHPEYGRNWDVLVKMSPYPRFLDHTSPLINGRRTGEPVKGDQNSTAWNQGPRKGLAGMPNWQWLAAYGPRVEGFGFAGTKGEWLLTRLKAAGAPELGLNGNAEADASDAGMVFGQMPEGKTDATMAEIQEFFLGKPLKAIAFPSGAKAGHPCAHVLICCRGSNNGTTFEVNGKMTPNHDYSDVEQARDLLQKIKDAGIQTVIIDMSNASQWTDLWSRFEPMVNNIRKVTQEKGMTYFVLIGAQFTSGDMKKRMVAGGPFGFWNNIAGKIYGTWAKDPHYQRYGHGDDRPMLLAFNDGKTYWKQFEETKPEYKNHLEKFRIGNTQINQVIKNPHESDGWGYRSQWQNKSGSVRFVSPNGGVEPSTWFKISGEEWEKQVRWARQASEYSVYGSYDDTCDSIFWGIADVSKSKTAHHISPDPRNPRFYYDILKQELTGK